DTRASIPGHGEPDTAAPPTASRRSSTITDRPARASRVAATRPLWPPPTITTSRRASTYLSFSVSVVVLPEAFVTATRIVNRRLWSGPCSGGVPTLTAALTSVSDRFTSSL